MMSNKKNTRNFSEPNVIAISDDAEIIIDHLRGEISFLSHGVGPVLKIKDNKSVILKANKNSVSTCNTCMLAYYLKHNPIAARELAARYSFKFNAVQKIEKSLVSFLAGMSIGEFSIFISIMNSGTIGNAAHDVNKIIISYLLCTDHTAKMAGMVSCSTYVKYNQFCLARRKNCPGAICEHCFAYDQTSAYSTQALKLAKSHVFFTTIELCEDDIPDIDISIYPYFRFESFGDISSALQFKNYCTIARKLKQLCTLWSKNPGIIQNAISSGVAIPDNLRVGLSSLYINKPDIETAKKYPFIKFLFTVYTKEYAIENNININCGARCCLTCARCYDRALNDFGDGYIMLVNEILK